MMRFTQFLILGLASMFCMADVAIIVHKDNANAAITPADLKKIYLGKQATFPNGSTAIPIDLTAGPSREVFYDKVVEKNGAQLRAYWSRLIFTGQGQPPRQEETEAGIVKLVSANPNLIAYVDKGAVDGSVKVIYEFS